MNKVYQRILSVAILATLILVSCQKDFETNLDIVPTGDPVIFFTSTEDSSNKLKWIEKLDFSNDKKVIEKGVFNKKDTVLNQYYVGIDLKGIRNWYHRANVVLVDDEGIEIFNSKQTVRTRVNETNFFYYAFDAPVGFDNQSWTATLSVNGEQIGETTIYYETCDDGIKNRNEQKVDCGGECDACYDLLEYKGENASDYTATIVNNKVSLSIINSSYEKTDLLFDLVENETGLTTIIDSNSTITDVVVYDIDTSFYANYIEVSKINDTTGTMTGFFNLRGVYNIQNGNGSSTYTTASGKFVNLKVAGLRTIE